jgi:hypothetical protein
VDRVTVFVRKSTLIGCSAFREDFPAKNSETPDIAQGRVLAVVQCLRRCPLNRNLKKIFCQFLKNKIIRVGTEELKGFSMSIKNHLAMCVHLVANTSIYLTVYLSNAHGEVSF